ncbi:unnamed protein product [Mytilus coruscus]|uniref:Uncharacterized protein n=1 Tax=Mytilus coruscus TaxID=42192 RepID=A0A6J8AGA5_MYTCO|nr:unnamed protein product [Mytilus coruscus]
MRTMNEHILEECNARGIDIVCTCFDGQWIKLATRDVDERPLTLLQLQRDVYETASKEKRNTILKHLSENQLLMTLKMILTHIELNIIIELTEQYQRKAAFPIRKSWKILDKANAVSKLIGSGIQKERTVKRMVSLKESALKVVQNNTRYVPKSKLNNVYAVTLYKDSYRSWISKSPFNETTEVEGVGHVKWFSYPEVSEKRNKMEPKCLDAHHLLVNLRVKVCKDGLQGIQKRAWHAVAEKNRDIISKSLVVDLIDKQNNAFALRTFSTDVESEMRKLGFIREADFCKLIREWYEAEDESGISAVDRMKRRINLKSFLLEGVDFGRYPMYGMYVKGFPKVQFEGFLQRIDTSLQLYSVVKNGSLTKEQYQV